MSIGFLPLGAPLLREVLFRPDDWNFLADEVGKMELVAFVFLTQARYSLRTLIPSAAAKESWHIFGEMKAKILSNMVCIN